MTSLTVIDWHTVVWAALVEWITTGLLYAGIEECRKDLFKVREGPVDCNSPIMSAGSIP